MVDTQSVGSIAPGLRNYTLSADEPGTGWVTVATETGSVPRPPTSSSPSTRWSVQRPARSRSPRSTSAGTTAAASPRSGRRPRRAAAFVHALEAYAGTGGPPSSTAAACPRSAWSDPRGDGNGEAPATTLDDTTPPRRPPPHRPLGISPAPGPGDGYRMVTSAAQVSAFGADPSYGPDGAHSLNRPIVGMADTPTAAATGSSVRTAASSTSATPRFFGSTGALGPQRPHRRHGLDPRRSRLLARRSRRRHLRHRRRPLRRVDRGPRGSTGPSWAWPPPPTAAATGWSPPTAASSPSATLAFFGSTGALRAQPAHRGHGRHPRRQRLLAGRLRRRHLRLRRRRLLRVDRRPPRSTGLSRA